MIDDSQEWFDSLQDDVDDEQAEIEAQQAANDLEIMLALYDKGYHPDKFDVILKQIKGLDLPHKEILRKINNK